MTGIYFLLSGKTIVYIGKTENWPSRVAAHKMEFDQARIIECSRDLLTVNEQRAIRLFKPKQNRQYRVGSRRLLTDEWIIENKEEIGKAGGNWKSILTANDRLGGKIAQKAKVELGYSPRSIDQDIWTTIYYRYRTVVLNRPRHQ